MKTETIRMVPLVFQSSALISPHINHHFISSLLCLELSWSLHVEVLGSSSFDMTLTVYDLLLGLGLGVTGDKKSVILVEYKHKALQFHVFFIETYSK